MSGLLDVRGLRKEFPGRHGVVAGRRPAPIRAVDGVDLTVEAGKTLGVVGESGCGKSTLARCVARLLEPTTGEILFAGRDIAHLPASKLRPLRREFSFIFQDPYSSLNPRQTIGFSIAEPLVCHGVASGAELRRRVQELLELVGLNPEHYNRFPHQFSGGQRQRVGIARALALRPKLVVCDEPVSALDVSVQAQIVNLLTRLQRELGVAYLFITHDLGVLRHICDDVLVMYLGRTVEHAPSSDVFAMPRHPYTEALMSAAPVADPRRARGRTRTLLKGDVPSSGEPPEGCSFHPRCPRAVPGRCDVDAPALVDDDVVGRQVACFYPLGGTAS